MKKKKIFTTVYWGLIIFIIIYGNIQISKVMGFEYTLRTSLPFLTMLALIFIGMPLYLLFCNSLDEKKKYIREVLVYAPLVSIVVGYILLKTLHVKSFGMLFLICLLPWTLAIIIGAFNIYCLNKSKSVIKENKSQIVLQCLYVILALILITYIALHPLLIRIIYNPKYHPLMSEPNKISNLQ